MLGVLWPRMIGKLRSLVDGSFWRVSSIQRTIVPTPNPAGPSRFDRALGRHGTYFFLFGELDRKNTSLDSLVGVGNGMDFVATTGA